MKLWKKIIGYNIGLQQFLTFLMSASLIFFFLHTICCSFFLYKGDTIVSFYDVQNIEGNLFIKFAQLFFILGFFLTFPQTLVLKHFCLEQKKGFSYFGNFFDVYCILGITIFFNTFFVINSTVFVSAVFSLFYLIVIFFTKPLQFSYESIRLNSLVLYNVLQSLSVYQDICSMAMILLIAVFFLKVAPVIANFFFAEMVFNINSLSFIARFLFKILHFLKSHNYISIAIYVFFMIFLPNFFLYIAYKKIAYWLLIFCLSLFTILNQTYLEILRDPEFCLKSLRSLKRSKLEDMVQLLEELLSNEADWLVAKKDKFPDDWLVSKYYRRELYLIDLWHKNVTIALNKILEPDLKNNVNSAPMKLFYLSIQLLKENGLNDDIAYSYFSDSLFLLTNSDSEVDKALCEFLKKSEIDLELGLETNNVLWELEKKSFLERIVCKNLDDFFFFQRFRNPHTYNLLPLTL